MTKRAVLSTILILLVILSTGCNNDIKEQNNEGDTMKGKILMIIAQNNFRDEELSIPKQIFEKNNYKVDIASITTEIANGMLGAKVKPDAAVKAVDASDYECVVVVGGSGAIVLAEDADVLDAVRNAKNVGAICLGPMVLAKAGVLKEKNATVFRTEDSLAAFEEGGAIYIDESVVVDGSTVTANGPKAAKEFANKIIATIDK